MKIGVFILALIHGIIHLLGFFKAFKLAEISQLTKPISQPIGLLWLLSFFLFLLFASAFFSSKPWAGHVGIAAVILSQVLIFIFWKDAKFGSLPNLILLFFAIQYLADNNWGSMMEKEVNSLNEEINIPSQRPLEELPPAVQKWLKTTGLKENQIITQARINQTAKMKMDPDQENWREANASQSSSIDPPSFHWEVSMKLFPGLFISGRDKFENGQGEMLIKLNRIFPIVNAKGPKIDEGSLQRYLGEMVWIPSLARHPSVEWKVLDESTAQATLTIAGTSGSGIFHFDQKGDFIRFEADRYFKNEPDSQRFPWILEVENYGEFQEIRIPSKMKATWRLKEKDWTWLELQIDSVIYTFDKPSPINQ